MRPKLATYLACAIVVSLVWIALRFIGALALNGALDGTHLLHFLTDSWTLPQYFLYALGVYVVVGTPLFLLARSKQWLTAFLFSAAGLLIGYLLGFPEWTILPWPAFHAGCGLLAGLSSFYFLRHMSSPDA